MRVAGEAIARGSPFRFPKWRCPGGLSPVLQPARRSVVVGADHVWQHVVWQHVPDRGGGSQAQRERVEGVSLKISSILFVCLGNICRSPAAQALASDFATKLGVDDRVEIASAGTANYQVGRPADARMREAAARRGYSIDTKARQLTAEMVRDANWLIAMDRENYRESLRIARDYMPAQIHLLSDFLDDQWPRDVPDPYLGGGDQFEYVLDMLEAAMPKLFLSVFPQAMNGSDSGG